MSSVRGNLDPWGIAAGKSSGVAPVSGQAHTTDDSSQSLKLSSLEIAGIRIFLLEDEGEGLPVSIYTGRARAIVRWPWVFRIRATLTRDRLHAGRR